MSHVTAAPRRRRVTTAAVLTGVLGSTALALSMGATLSGFTASITNSTNTAASATLAVEETSGQTTCRSWESTTSCEGINKFGGTATPMVPGGSQTTTVTFRNVGTTAVATSNLTPQACGATSTGATGASAPTSPNTSAGNLCSVLNVTIYKGATAGANVPKIFEGKASALSSRIELGALAKDASQAYTFVVSLPADATTAIQGQQVSQPLTWSFAQ